MDENTRVDLNLIIDLSRLFFVFDCLETKQTNSNQLKESITYWNDALSSSKIETAEETLTIDARLRPTGGQQLTDGEWEAHVPVTTGQWQDEVDSVAWKSMLLTCYDHIMEMASDGNIPFLPLRYSSFSRLLVFLMRLCSEFETNAAAGSGCKRDDKSKRVKGRKKWLVLTRLLIWHWIISYISLASVWCVDERTETTTTCGKDNETARTMTTIG